MTLFLMALGLAIALEGLFYGAFPALVKEFTRQVSEMPEQTIRSIGIVAAAGGVGLVWLARTLGG